MIGTPMDHLEMGSIQACARYRAALIDGDALCTQHPAALDARVGW